MDFLKPEIRNYFFKQEPAVKTKIDDLPPAKYNPGADVKNSLISSGCIVNGVVENSVLFKEVYVGNNCVIKNSVILNDVYLGDNTISRIVSLKAGEPPGKFRTKAGRERRRACGENIVRYSL